MLRAATRASDLARWQTQHVARLLGEAAHVQPVLVSTTGDRLADTPISNLGGKGVFVKEVQAAVLQGRADIAVHSAKDLPAETPEGLLLAAVPLRADPRDTLVGSRLAELPQQAVVATGAPRRRAQLRALRPDLRFAELRGNIATRLAKAGDFAAIVVAQAALDRLNQHPEPAEALDVHRMVPQVGQGALAVECRAEDTSVADLLAGIEDPDSRRAVDAERAFLVALGGDCTLPAGCHASIGAGTVHMRAVLADTTGAPLHTAADEGEDGEALGEELARRLRRMVDR